MVPDNINQAFTGNLFKLYFSPVVAGEWDKDCESLETFDIIYSFQNHFNEGTSWEETDFYSRALSCINDGREWVGWGKLDTPKDLDDYLDRIETLFIRIKREGYKTQNCLQSEKENSIWVRNSRALELHEVTVHIDREGQILLEDGWHRLSMSKILGLESIPVRIAYRHKNWQKIREKVLRTGEIPEEYEGHPDLTALLED